MPFPARVFAITSLIALAACSAPSSSAIPSRALWMRPIFKGNASRAPVPCSQLTTLRALHRELVYLRNPSTGDGIEYVVVGDAAAAAGDVLVYFPGTGQILPGWPTQLITNSTYSPKITSVPGYRTSEDAKVSLCHAYRLVFFDYPGVGRTKSVTFTKDDVANDVDAMLNDIAVRFRISTNTVDPVGWSLGTTNAMKYAFLSPASRPSRTIHNVILYSGHGGGSIQAKGSGSASCVQTLFAASLTASGSVATQVKEDLTELIFPFKGQGLRDNGTHSGCRARVTKKSVHLSVTPICNLINGCTQYIDGYLADIATRPWKITAGLDDAVYTQERQQSGDWDVAYCAQALPHFTSGDCTAYGTIQQSSTNGGICKTNTLDLNRPRAIVCNALDISGKVTLLDGYEDLLVQWTYDRALADGLNRAKAGLASYSIYPGSTGHGILIQHPRWAQAMTYAAMQN